MRQYRRSTTLQVASQRVQRQLIDPVRWMAARVADRYINYLMCILGDARVAG